MSKNADYGAELALIDALSQLRPGGEKLSLEEAEHVLAAFEAVPSMRHVRYVAAQGDTLAEMRERFRETELYKAGDAALVWANRGDLYMPSDRSADAQQWQPMETAPKHHGAKIIGSYDVGDLEAIQPLYYSTFDWKWRRKLDGVTVEEPKAWLPYPSSRHQATQLAAQDEDSQLFQDANSWYSAAQIDEISQRKEQ